MMENRPEATATAAVHDALTAAEQTALLERIAASPQFRRATRLRELLLFVAQRSARHGSAPVHEQEIGSAVFERPNGTIPASTSSA